MPTIIEELLEQYKEEALAVYHNGLDPLESDDILVYRLLQSVACIVHVIETGPKDLDLDILGTDLVHYVAVLGDYLWTGDHEKLYKYCSQYFPVRGWYAGTD